ncbi:TetR/AcrR family transcriptional regulator [Sediminivirga luteola]|uniref:TetR/AcrR family transcriptional regulator n=1 Tax=Sediminivirga luteola TaxID=1774748 RepID=UPI001F57A2AE|nr:TetR/AcrR family transcriptional regulator [Sediminivirga luteola]MCI2264575.1 TetR/AcrR family transcriptional regulator [Sediminivirga luteola]
MPRPSVSTDHILDSAANLLARRGFDHVTTEDIAKAAGVAKGVLYLRFASKDELFGALLDREFANAVRALATLVEEDPRGGLLSRLYLHSLRAVHASPVLTAFYSAAHGESRVVARLVRDRSGSRYPARQVLGTDFFEELHRKGMIRADIEPGTLARLLAVWSVGLAASAPHDDIDALVVGIGDLIARAVDADVTDTTPGKVAFAEFAHRLIDHAEQTAPAGAGRKEPRP